MGLLGCDRAGDLVLRWAMWGCALWVCVGMAVGLWVVRLLSCLGKRKKEESLRTQRLCDISRCTVDVSIYLLLDADSEMLLDTTFCTCLVGRTSAGGWTRRCHLTANVARTWLLATPAGR